MNQDIVDCVGIMVKKVNEYKKIAESKGVCDGVIKGNQVVIGGISYSYDCAVDMNFSSGDTVACVLTNDSRKAVIVGSR